MSRTECGWECEILHPPVKIADLRAALEDFDAARAQLFDRGKKVFVRRDKCRDIVVKLLVQLGHYVEAAAEDDIVVFLSSGFQPQRKAGAVKECDAPSIYKIVQGKSGVLSVYFTPFYRQVIKYEFRWGPQVRNSFSPDAWTETRHLRQGRRPIVVENLTPGTIYCFQVRAYRTNETYTEWSGIASLMCI